jgi:hypothetical protein
MRQAGIPPTDQRYLAVLKILKIQTQFGIQLNATNFPQLATQGYLLQSQPQASVQVQPKQPSLPSQTATPSFSAHPPQALTTPQSMVNSFTPQPQTSSATSDKKTPLSSYQVFQLKAQIMAYKYLSKNMPLPPKLLTALRTFTLKAQQEKAVPNQKPVPIQTLPSSIASKPSLPQTTHSGKRQVKRI